jgi:hypothetical protein
MRRNSGIVVSDLEKLARKAEEWKMITTTASISIKASARMHQEAYLSHDICAVDHSKWLRSGAEDQDFTFPL